VNRTYSASSGPSPQIPHHRASRSHQIAQIATVLAWLIGITLALIVWRATR
jgi:ABC-type spermidine/putrescine transport system permease subunit II